MPRGVYPHKRRGRRRMNRADRAAAAQKRQTTQYNAALASAANALLDVARLDVQSGGNIMARQVIRGLSSSF